MVVYFRGQKQARNGRAALLRGLFVSLWYGSIYRITTNEGSVMDVYHIRFKNYQFLFDRFKESVWREWPGEPEHGMLRRFGTRLDISEAYMSHLNTQYKPIGTRMARKIEAALKLPAGWMDQDHDNGAPRTPDEADFVKAAVELYRQSPNEAQAALIQALTKKMLDS